MIDNRYLSIITILFIFISNYTLAQKDSLYVMTMHDQAYNLELEDPNRAIEVYDSAASISKEIGYPIGEGRSYNYKAIVLFEQGKYLEAKELNLLAMPLFESIGYKAGVAASLVNLGNIELYLGNYQQGMDFYIEGIKTYEEIKDSSRLVMTLNNISTLFLNNQQFEKGVEYAQRSLELSRQIGDSITIADSYINLANGYLMKGDSGQYLVYSTNAFQIAQKTHDLYNQILASNNIAKYYIQKNEIDSAYFFANKTLELTETYKNPYNHVVALSTLGEIAFLDGRSSLAMRYLKQSEAISKQYNLNNLRLKVAYQLYIVENALGLFKNAAEHLAIYTALKDSVDAIETTKYVHLLEQRFESKKKETTIENQKLSIAGQQVVIQRNQMSLIAAGIILILLLLLAFFLKRSIKQKNRAHDEQIKRMEVEKINASIHAVIEGQEQERKRLSQELHDGVNGGLAAIKLMTSNFKKQKDNGSSLTEIVTMLDDLSVEVRDISHNLMPGTLAKGSLSQSTEELIAKFNHSDAVDFQYQTIGDIDECSENAKFYTYRIIQELLKNVIKHARATECLVQLSQNNGTLNVCIEDNGIGIDTDKTLNGGIGIKNIQSRLDFLNGTIEWNSSSDNGTAVNIDIPIK